MPGNIPRNRRQENLVNVTLQYERMSSVFRSGWDGKTQLKLMSRVLYWEKHVQRVSIEVGKGATCEV